MSIFLFYIYIRYFVLLLKFNYLHFRISVLIFDIIGILLRLHLINKIRKIINNI